MSAAERLGDPHVSDAWNPPPPLNISGTAQEMPMADEENPKLHPDPNSNAEKDPADWVSGDDPMTGAQASYLKTLCEAAGEEFDANLNKADASRRIDELKSRKS
jgi:hypothetical protein